MEEKLSEAQAKAMEDLSKIFRQIPASEIQLDFFKSFSCTGCKRRAMPYRGSGSVFLDAENNPYCDGCMAARVLESVSKYKNPSYAELEKAFREAVEHLEYCGYGDNYERECAVDMPQRFQKLIERLDAAGPAMRNRGPEAVLVEESE